MTVKIIAITLVLATLTAVGLTVTASAQTTCNGCTSPNGSGACYQVGAQICYTGGCTPGQGYCRGAVLQCTSGGWMAIGRC